ncbi:MAG: ATP-binding domain-containing protein [Nitriliruptoraceae bacterium]
MGANELAPSVPPGHKQRALAEEQRTLNTIHDRVDVLRQRAQRLVAQTAADQSGSTFQARFERDATAHHHAVRAAQYTFGDIESLAFGRLDLRDGDQFHVGRVSVVDEHGDVLLVDWRAPVAAAFYRATAARPERVARRPTLATRGRTLVDIDDELIDVEAADALGLDAVTGQGALLAALTRDRRPQMQDIVATIQTDQDDIIRSPARGTMIVTGGPGTGKTVVALHRVAYLLYHDRERFEGRGVLVIGPSPAFTEYTGRVLPSLGENRVVQRPLAALAPADIPIDGWDAAPVAFVKGLAVFARICHRALAAWMPKIPMSTRINIDGTTADLGGADLTKLRDRFLGQVQADRPGSSYCERREPAVAALHHAIWRGWQAARQRQGQHVPTDPADINFVDALNASASYVMLLRSFWPAPTPHGLFTALADGTLRLDELAHDLLSHDQIVAVTRSWQQADGVHVEDAPLLDEFDALIGSEPVREKDTGRDVGIRLSFDALQLTVDHVDVAAAGYRDFAHVVVDEAQDLSPMQWRSVARRGPYASWTIVGDLGQRSRIGKPETWEQVAQLVGRSQVSIRSLTVNYRTPAEIAEIAVHILAASGTTASAASAVRFTGQRPRLLRSDNPASLVARIVEERFASHDGTVAVIAPTNRLSVLRAQLPAGTSQRLRILDPRTAKGLEFDDVILVSPDEIQSEPHVGLQQLYVSVTRATKTLTAICGPGVDFVAAALFDQ